MVRRRYRGAEAFGWVGILSQPWRPRRRPSLRIQPAAQGALMVACCYNGDADAAPPFLCAQSQTVCHESRNPKRMAPFVDRMVAERRFLTESDVLAEGLRLLQSRETLRQEIRSGFHQLDQGPSASSIFNSGISRLGASLMALTLDHLG